MEQNQVVGKQVILIAVAGLFLIAWLHAQEDLAKNAFLVGFVNHEVLGLMSVILTVTLASVANIHLALNRIVAKRFGGNEELKASAKEVKSELTDNAWYIFWGFVAAIGALLVKGAFPSDHAIVAAVHAAVMWLLLLFILCMYDIYKVVFGIVNLEMDIGSDQNDEEDYSSDSPEIGKD